MNFYTAKRTSLIVLIILFSVVQLFAQSNGSVSGTLNDATNNEPLGFATIAILPKGGTAPIASKQTDINGKFTLSGLKDGTYTLRASYVGYLTVNTPLVIAA